MKPIEVYIGALKYHFASLVVRHNSEYGDISEDDRRVYYHAARWNAANYVFRHNFANAKISLPVWVVDKKEGKIV